MTTRNRSHLSEVLRPIDDELIAKLNHAKELEDAGDNDTLEIHDDGTMSLNLPVAIFDTPTPYETRPDGSVSRMKKTRGFRALYRASERLAELGAQPSLSYEELGQVWVARALLSYAQQEAQKDPKVTPELYMRAQLSESLANITALTGSIIETHDQPRMIEAYEELFFADTYERLLEVGRELVKKHREPNTGRVRARYSGFAHELVFHLLQFRQQNALRFSTAASVYEDYFQEGQRFDATAFNLKLGREKSVHVQIKTHPEQLAPGSAEDFRVIYGTADLHNMIGDDFWHDTLQAGRALPTLSALLDEAAGDTTNNAKLDAITTRLHSRLFS